jgi:hypothetical protein
MKQPEATRPADAKAKPPGHSGRVAKIAVAMAALLTAAAAAPAQERADTAPATTAPAAQPGPAGADEPRIVTTTPSLPSAGDDLREAAGRQSFRDNLAIDDEEREALIAARGRPTQLDETGLFVMLAKAARVPGSSGYDPSRLARPLTGQLARHPQQFYNQPIRLRMLPFRVRKLERGKPLSYNRRWPIDADSDGTVWWVTGFDADEQTQEPLIVLSVTEPQIPGRPETLDDGSILYKNPPIIEVVGIFYKMRRDRDQDGNVRDYPVVVAWEAAPRLTGDQPLSGGGRNTLFTSSTLIGLIGVVVLMLLFFLRVRSRRGQATATYSNYRPLREELDELDREMARRRGDDIEVDPALREAAEQARGAGGQKPPARGNMDQPEPDVGTAEGQTRREDAGPQQHPEKSE